MIPRIPIVWAPIIDLRLPVWMVIRAGAVLGLGWDFREGVPRRGWGW